VLTGHRRKTSAQGRRRSASLTAIQNSASFASDSGQIVARIYLLCDNSFKSLMITKSTTAAEACGQFSAKLRLNHFTPSFMLKEITPSRTRAIGANELIWDILMTWESEGYKVEMEEKWKLVFTFTDTAKKRLTMQFKKQESPDEIRVVTRASRTTSDAGVPPPVPSRNTRPTISSRASPGRPRFNTISASSDDRLDIALPALPQTAQTWRRIGPSDRTDYSDYHPNNTPFSSYDSIQPLQPTNLQPQQFAQQARPPRPQKRLRQSQEQKERPPPQKRESQPRQQHQQQHQQQQRQHNNTNQTTNKRPLSVLPPLEGITLPEIPPYAGPASNSFDELYELSELLMSAHSSANLSSVNYDITADVDLDDVLATFAKLAAEG